MKKLSLWRRTLAVLGLRQAPPLAHFNKPVRRSRRPLVEQLEDRALLATLSIGPGGLHVAEGGTATLQVSISPPQMQPTSFTFRTVSGTAIGGTDYQDIPSGNDTIPPGASFTSVSIPALNDFFLEEQETFSVQLMSASGATINPSASSAVVTIDNVQSGGGGGSGGSLTVSLSLPTDVDEGETFTLAGTINAGGNYYVTGTINWGATSGEGTTSFSVNTNPNGSFSIPHRYLDDGPDPGNDTDHDLESITITGTAMPMMPGGGSSLSVTGSATTTIHNVAPEPVFDIYNYMPIGGPQWVVSCTYHDDGLTDRATITVDWGDGSAPLVFANVLTGFSFNTNSTPHRYPSDGLSYTISITVTDDDTGSVSFSEPAPLYLFDLDNDANNNGEIAASDEPYEPVTPDEYPAGPHIAGPGRYISVNGDDDNEDGIADMDQLGPISGENDLEPFLIRWRGDMRPDIDNYAGWHILLQVPQQQPDWAFLNPRIWFNPDKSPGPLELDPDGNGRLDLDEINAQFAGKDWTIGDLQDPIPATLYVEARQTGGIELQLHLSTPTGEPVEADTIAFTAVAADTDVDLIIHHGQSGAAVKDADEEIRGAVTVANRNDTDADSLASEGNHKRDFEDPDGVIKTNDHGRDELDLMLLEAKRPVGYVVGEPVDLWIMPGDRVRLWQDERKVTPYPGYTAGAGSVSLSWAAGETAPKKIWVEIVSKSETVADIQFDLSYGGKSDTVKATGLWVERTAVAYQDADFIRDLTKWPAPWKNAPKDIYTIVDVESGGPKGNTIGTGVRAKWMDGTTSQFSNIILFEFQVYPANAQEFFKDVVRFDVTRQMENKKWIVGPGGGVTPIENEPLPVQWERANDDANLGPMFASDESLEPDVAGKMYSVDSPGFPADAFFGVGTKFYGRWNFYEYVRVRLDGVKPDNNTLQGSQCSGNYSWHSRMVLEKKAAGWERVNEAANKINDIGLDRITIGDAP